MEGGGRGERGGAHHPTEIPHALFSDLLPLGLFYGVTTNPVLLERAKVPCDESSLKQLAQSAFALGAQEFMCQSWCAFLSPPWIRFSSSPFKSVVALPETTAGAGGGTLDSSQSGGASCLPSAAAYSGCVTVLKSPLRSLLPE